MIDKEIYSTFKKGSRTYFYSSLFFPSQIRNDVFTLYAFVRKADNYVDTIPQQKKEFYNFVSLYEKACRGDKTGDIIVDSFVELMNKGHFNYEWVNAFLRAMEMDLTVKQYENMSDLLKYVYGSAEVIGIMMAKIMGLPQQTFADAGLLGRAMQYINFIRDISEDIDLNRCYFPQDELNNYGLTSFEKEAALKNKKNFNDFIRKQIDYYCSWQLQAEKSFNQIPTRYLIPIKTASEMYKWTAKQIYRNPAIVYDKKVKPRVSRIIGTVMYSVFGKTDTITTCPLKYNELSTY